jgi:hypothetical protein
MVLGNRPALLAALVLVGAIVLSWPSLALAGPAAQKRAAFHFNGPPDTDGCITSEALAGAVAERLKRPVFVPDDEADVVIEARVEQRKVPRKWHARILLTTPTGAVLGTREIESPEASCRSLDESLVLVIALLIDPDAALGLPPSGPPEAPPAPPEPPREVPSTPPAPPNPNEKPLPPRSGARPPRAAPSLPWRFQGEGGVVLALGLLPGLGVGATLRATLIPPRFWAIQVEGTYWPEHKLAVDEVGGGFSLAYAGLSLCPLEVGSRLLHGNGCAGMKVGGFMAHGFGFDQPNTQNSLLVNASLEGRVRYRPTKAPVVASLGLGLSVPLTRLRFFYQLPDGSTREVFRLSQTIGTLDAGIGIEVP